MGMLIMAILWTILPMTGNLLASNPEFIAANGDSIRITWIQAFSKVFPERPGGLGLSVGKCSVWGMVRPGAVRDRHRSHPYPQDHGAGRRQARPSPVSFLCIVTAAIFSSLFGAGAVVAIGVIILPIFMSLGIPKVLSVVSFMLSIGRECF